MPPKGGPSPQPRSKSHAVLNPYARIEVRTIVSAESVGSIVDGDHALSHAAPRFGARESRCNHRPVTPQNFQSSYRCKNRYTDYCTTINNDASARPISAHGAHANALVAAVSFAHVARARARRKFLVQTNPHLGQFAAPAR